MFSTCDKIKHMLLKFRRLNMLLVLASLLFGNQLFAQKQIKLSLEQARTYALEHNHTLKVAALDVESARYRVKESTATGLPQIDATINYIDNIGLPVQLLPGEFLDMPGEDIAIQFGTKYNASASGTINQLLFSGSYLVGLQAAKTFLEKTRQDYIKNQIEVNKTVSEAYFLVLATQESLAVIDSTLSITSRLAEETRIIVSEGFAEETELDQLELLVAELEISRMNANTQMDIALAFLKYQLGITDDTRLELSENLFELATQSLPEKITKESFSANRNIDFQVLKKQQELAHLQLKLEKSHYLPTLSAFLNYQTQAQRQVWNFFDNKGKWYSSSMVGITMNIPIFSSGERHARVQQARFQFEQTLIAEKQVKTSLQLQYESTLNELSTAWQTFNNSTHNKQLASRIFQRTGVKYSEGMAGSLDLLNTHNQYLSAQSRYINSALNLLNQYVALESLMQ
jgi:outer membrane protein